MDRDNYRKALVEYFTPHIINLCDDCKERLKKNPLRILDCKVDKDSDILKNAPKIIDYLTDESKTRFEKVLEYLDLLKIDYVVNPNIVRGLDYYNHTVFEIEAKVNGFGSQNVIGAGGRYNSLVEELEGPKNTSCMGFASGVGRVLLALEKENIILPIEDDIDLFLLYVNEEEKKYAMYLAQEMRMNGFKVEMDYLNRSLKGQFKQADRLNSKYLGILNSNDIDNNIITIKNNKTKEEDKIDMEYLIYYFDEKLSLEDDLDVHQCECGHDHDNGECHCGGNCHHEDK